MRPQREDFGSPKAIQIVGYRGVSIRDHPKGDLAVERCDTSGLS